MPVIVVGLGNPGSKYAGTRHNIGFELIDQLAASLSARMGPGKGSFLIGDANYQGHKLVLVKPTTYMNLSGDAVLQVLNWYKSDVDRCLVCYDDINLPIGTIRLRPSGSAGGHNGIKDIIRKLGTNRFPRLRIGIGDEFPEGRQVAYVLSRFSKTERETMAEVLDRAKRAVLKFADAGIDEAMNQFN